MSDIAARYRRLPDAFAAKVASVPDDRWSNPTPCAEWTTRELVGHVVGGHATFLGLIGHIDPDDATRTLEGAHTFGDAFRSPSVCGPELPVGHDADIQARLLAFYGRPA